MKKIKVFVVPVFGGRPEVREIDGSLEEMQRIVGGNIECIPLELSESNELDIVCNEEGKFYLSPNREIWDGEECVFGTFFVARPNAHGDYVSLTDEDILECERMFL